MCSISPTRIADIYDLLIERPEPLVPPSLRYPLAERIYSDGSIVTPLDPQAVRALIPALRRQQVQAVAVCLLHSYKNPRHEQVIAEVLRQEAPDLYLTCLLTWCPRFASIRAPLRPWPTSTCGR